MKNLVFTLIFIFPLIVTAIFYYNNYQSRFKIRVGKRKSCFQRKSQKKKLTIDKHASKMRVYFYLND